MMMNPTPESWDQWGHHVLAELERLNLCLLRQAENLGSMQATIAGLQVKAGVWGAIAGAIPGVVALVFIFLKAGG